MYSIVYLQQCQIMISSFFFHSFIENTQNNNALQFEIAFQNIDSFDYNN